MSYNSKYTGAQVEDFLDQIANGEIGGGITEETDPIFSASPAASITEDDIRGWNSDHVIIEDLNIDVAQLIQDVEDKQDAISDLETIRSNASKGATAVQPETLSEYALEGYVDNEVKALGDSLAEVATSGSYNDLQDKPTIPSAINIAGTNYTPSGNGIIDLNSARLYRKPSGGIPKEDFSSGVQTSLRNADAYKGTVTGVKINGITKSPSNGVVDLGNIPTSIPSEVYITDFTMESLRDGIYNGTNVDCNVRALVDAMNANKVILVRECEDSSYKGVHILNGYAEDLLYFSIVDTPGNILWCDGTDYISLQGIDAQSLHERSWGSKQDTISDLATIREGAAKGATALQSYTEKYTGTITGITMNGVSKGTSGIVDLGNVITSHQDIRGKKDKPNVQNVTTASVSLVLTPNTIYNCTSALTDITISSFNTTSEGYEEYMVLFKSGNATTISLPSDVCWANDEQPEIDAYTEYELSISKRVVDGANIFKAILVPFKTIE